MKKLNRKQFLKSAVVAAAAIGVGKLADAKPKTKEIISQNHLPNQEIKTMKKIKILLMVKKAETVKFII